MKTNRRDAEIRDIVGPENMAVACECGAVHQAHGLHYDRFVMKCGRRYWALRPERHGLLKLFPWPGPNLTREEMGGQKSAEQIVRGMNQP